MSKEHTPEVPILYAEDVQDAPDGIPTWSELPKVVFEKRLEVRTISDLTKLTLPPNYSSKSEPKISLPPLSPGSPGSFPGSPVSFPVSPGSPVSFPGSPVRSPISPVSFPGSPISPLISPVSSPIQKTTDVSFVRPPQLSSPKKF